MAFQNNSGNKIVIELNVTRFFVIKVWGAFIDCNVKIKLSSSLFCHKMGMMGKLTSLNCYGAQRNLGTVISDWSSHWIFQQSILTEAGATSHRQNIWGRGSLLSVKDKRSTATFSATIQSTGSVGIQHSQSDPTCSCLSAAWGWRGSLMSVRKREGGTAASQAASQLSELACTPHCMPDLIHSCL